VASYRQSRSLDDPGRTVWSAPGDLSDEDRNHEGSLGCDLTMDRKIIESHAIIADRAQMGVFLAPIPNADSLEALLMERRVVSTRTYEDDAMIARFVRSNGTTVACYTVQDVTIDEAEMIAAQCELLDDWNVENFSRAVHAALDPDL
jgi:hypothetical protein